MKKLLLFVIIILACSSCYDSKTHENDSPKTITSNVPYVYTKITFLEDKSYTYGQISFIKHFTYNGHDYIHFHVCETHGGSDMVVHDPDCKCAKSEE